MWRASGEAVTIGYLASQVRQYAESIRGGGKDRILVNVYSKNQSQKIMRGEQIAGVKCQVSEDTFVSNTRGLVFIQNYHITDL